MPAPIATTSSGFTPLLGSLPKIFFTAPAPPAAGHAADEQDLVDLARRQASVAQRRGGAVEPIDQIAQRFQLGAGELHVEMLGTALVGGDEQQVDVESHGGRELHLGALARFLETLQRHAVLAQVDALVILNSSAR